MQWSRWLVTLSFKEAESIDFGYREAVELVGEGEDSGTRISGFKSKFSHLLAI